MDRGTRKGERAAERSERYFPPHPLKCFYTVHIHIELYAGSSAYKYMKYIGKGSTRKVQCVANMYVHPIMHLAC